ncbi:MAG TPA: DUF262 domain-containing protein [Chitinophagales bacterium]|nr:DUF262 domain-containing protein [Chitinophagales bacterium]
MSENILQIEGEDFEIKAYPEIDQTKLSDDVINEKYNKGEIRIVTEQARYPLDSIPVMLDSGKYDRNPEYQRRKRWDDSRKSKLIESIIMNVPIPPIFLYEVEYNSYEVMDGLQRLTAIDDFYKDKFILSDLQYWKELNGKKYSTLPDQVKKGIDRRYLSSIILLQETAKTKEEAEFLKQIVFERLNSGGELLTAQETRNALYNGKFNQFCIRLAKNESFRKMWHMPLESEGEHILLKNIPYSKMEDVELVLRFFAYRHLDKLKGGTVENFLDEYLKQGNNFTPKTLGQLEYLFNETIDLLYSIFGESAFYLPSLKQNNKTPSKNIYDPIMQAFAKSVLRNEKQKLLDRSALVKQSLYQNIEELFSKDGRNKYLFDGKYTSRNEIYPRIQYFDAIIAKFL